MTQANETRNAETHAHLMTALHRIRKHLVAALVQYLTQTKSLPGKSYSATRTQQKWIITTRDKREPLADIAGYISVFSTPRSFKKGSTDGHEDLKPKTQPPLGCKSQCSKLLIKRVSTSVRHYKGSMLRAESIGGFREVKGHGGGRRARTPTLTDRLPRTCVCYRRRFAQSHREGNERKSIGIRDASHNEKGEGCYILPKKGHS